MLKNYIILIIICLAITACKEGIRPFKSWHVDEKIHAAYLSEDNNVLWVLSGKGLVQIKLEQATQEELEYFIELKDFSELICNKNYCWISGGRYLREGTLYLLDIATGRIRTFGADEYAEIYDIALSIRDNLLITAHANGEIIAWDAFSGQQKRRFGKRDTEIFALELPDNDVIYSGNGLGEIDVWDKFTGKLLTSVQNPLIAKDTYDNIFTIVHDPINNNVISGGGWGILYFRDDKRLSFQKSLKLNKGAILYCDISEDSSLLACAMTNGNVSIINTTDYQYKIVRAHKGDVLFVDFINEMSKLVSVSEDGAIYVWDFK